MWGEVRCVAGFGLVRRGQVLGGLRHGMVKSMVELGGYGVR